MQSKTTSGDELAKLKRELNNYLQFNELTHKRIHRLVNQIEIKRDRLPRIIYRFANESL